MKNSFWTKRIPTLFALIMVFVGVIFTSYAVKMGTNFFGIAAPPENPLDVRITNISDSSFTVSYKTTAKVLGSISLGKDKNFGTNVADDRDQESGNIQTYNIHYFTARNLEPKTNYFFQIASGQGIFLNNNEPFRVTTGDTVNDEPSGQKPLSGKIIFTPENSSREAVIYLTAPGSQTISGFVKEDGSYILPLNSVRNSDLNSYFSFSPDELLQILVVGVENESNATINAKHSNIPSILLSNNYDFTIDSEPIASPSGSFGFTSYSASPSSIKDPKIVAPKKDETFSDQQPLFKGTALPGSDVKIIIHSTDQVEAQIKSDNKGNWSYRPSSPLSPGEHTVSILAKDQYGIMKTLTQSFVVFAEGTQVNQSATPSATPTISLAPTATIPFTPTPTALLPTPTTIMASPTPIPTLIPTNLPRKVLPPAGNSSLIPVSLTILGTTIIGIILFLVTRGASSI